MKRETFDPSTATDQSTASLYTFDLNCNLVDPKSSAYHALARSDRPDSCVGSGELGATEHRSRDELGITSACPGITVSRLRSVPLDDIDLLTNRQRNAI